MKTKTAIEDKIKELVTEGYSAKLVIAPSRAQPGMLYGYIWVELDGDGEKHYETTSFFSIASILIAMMQDINYSPD